MRRTVAVAVVVGVLAWGQVANADVLTYVFDGVISSWSDPGGLIGPNPGTFSGTFTVDDTDTLAHPNIGAYDCASCAAALSPFMTLNLGGAIVTWGAERWTPSFGQVFVTAKVESGS